MLTQIVQGNQGRVGACRLAHSANARGAGGTFKAEPFFPLSSTHLWRRAGVRRHPIVSAHGTISVRASRIGDLEKSIFPLDAPRRSRISVRCLARCAAGGAGSLTSCSHLKLEDSVPAVPPRVPPRGGKANERAHFNQNQSKSNQF